MKNQLKKLFQSLGILNTIRGIRNRFKPYGDNFHMRFPTYDSTIQQELTSRAQHDYVRYASIALALKQVQTQNIHGHIAECGVWRGDLSTFLMQCAPTRRFYLFDTFEGFPKAQIESTDSRFQDTDVESVRAKFPQNVDVQICKGIFPDTAKGLEQEQFAFVMIDFDIYIPTVAALEFFYPRLAKGGYVFIHDVNSPESDHACYRAVTEFLQNKPEQFIEIPDLWGSVVFRKV